MESLKSVEEAAETLSLSSWTIRAYVRQGKIKPVRIGRRVLIEPQEIRRIIEQGRSQPAHSQERQESSAQNRACE